MLTLALLLIVFYVLALGVGMHVARHVGLYLLIAAVAVLPILVFSAFYGSSGNPVWILFTDLLGDQQAQHAGLHAAALLLGCLHGLVLQLRRGGRR